VLDFIQKRKKDIVCIKRKSNDNTKKWLFDSSVGPMFLFPAFINMKNPEDIRF